MDSEPFHVQKCSRYGQVKHLNKETQHGSPKKIDEIPFNKMYFNHDTNVSSLLWPIAQVCLKNHEQNTHFKAVTFISSCFPTFYTDIVSSDSIYCNCQILYG